MPARLVPTYAVIGAVLGAAAVSCSEARESQDSHVFDADVSAILASRCKECHAAAEGGRWAATSYLAAIACVRSGAAAIAPSTGDAPLLRALADPRHTKLSSADVGAVLFDWVQRGAPKFAGSVHEASFVDPRSPRSHGRVLRGERWRSMMDANSDTACGRCHEGAPSGRPDKITSAAPGATACTSCHAGEVGPLGCSTCHFGGEKTPSVTHNTCFFPNESASREIHAAHVLGGGVRRDGLPCGTCHPTPSGEPFTGTHGNGSIEVRLDEAVAGTGAAYDASSHACTTRCHAGPGALVPKPAWTNPTPLGCTGCHGSPPPAHPAGACSSCHREADDHGTSMRAGGLHVNGKVDLGDGSGRCGACHGAGDDPWPTTGRHALHRSPAHSAPVACESCHEVPTSFGAGAHPRGGAAVVRFGGLAVARGAAPTYDGGTCRQVYCHGAGVIGTTAASPIWPATSSGGTGCTDCHGIPPGPPHSGGSNCWSCHPSVVDPSPTGPVIAVPARHVNGETDR